MRLPANTIAQLRSTAAAVMRRLAQAMTSRTVNSSAPAMTTRIRPSENASPPSRRVTPYGSVTHGSLGIVALAFVAGWYRTGDGAVGMAALTLAQGKVEHTFLEALAGGILCNALVCLAVWLTYSARTTTDRILAIVPPIAAFVAAGLEHSVANMFFLPMAMAIRLFAPDAFWTATGASAATYKDIDLGSMVANLVPVTLGNVIGGAAIVAGVYWFVYLRKAA